MPADALSRWVLVVLFVAALALPPLVTLIAPKSDVSRAEKRRLAELPEFMLNNINNYPRDFEKYYDDNFGLRRLLVRGYNYLQVKLLGVSNTKWVLVGKDGWLYQGGEPHVRDMRNAWPYTPVQLRRWSEILQAKYQWLKTRDIEYLFVFTPNKNLAYREYLPSHIRPASDISRLDQLLAHLRATTEVPVLDLRPALKRAGNTMRTYHRTDTHWNAFGGYVGYRAIMAALAPKLPELRPLELVPDDFAFVDAPGGDLALMLDVQTWLREQRLQTKQPVERCARNPKLGRGASDEARFEHSFATYCATAPYRVLMFRDSFSFELMPYLSETFGYIFYHVHSPVSLKMMQEMVAEHKPDLVIEQRSSRWLRLPAG